MDDQDCIFSNHSHFLTRHTIFFVSQLFSYPITIITQILLLNLGKKEDIYL